MKLIEPAIHRSTLLAHQIELSGEVGATLHIEPTDNPRAGEPAVTWFALVTEGGQPIPLAACDCNLAVYALPRQPGDVPLSEPDLSPLSTEGYQAIPSTEITFPQVGEYELLFTGSAIATPEFSPFELSFEVLVARGTQSTTSSEIPSDTPSESSPDSVSVTAPSTSVTTPSTNVATSRQGTLLTPVVGLLVLGVVMGGMAYFVVKKKSG